MKQSIIERLRYARPKERLNILHYRFEKNFRFFQKGSPNTASMLERTTVSPKYKINITEKFLEIVSKDDDSLCHPQAGLDLFAEKLGSVSHKAWTDFVDLKVRSFEHHVDQKIHQNFLNRLEELFPEWRTYYALSNLDIPKNRDKRYFTDTVFFLGVFHGLHIAHFLNQCRVNNLYLIEPEPDRFFLSCYFLDYQKMGKEHQYFKVHTGAEIPESFLWASFYQAGTTSAAWIRVLTGYAGSQNEDILAALRLRWSGLSDFGVPLGWETAGLHNAAANIRNKQAILSEQPTCSTKARIAVIGAGPSLENDLDWLRDNQDKLIIFAVHSSIRTLKAGGIRPDFQVSLEMTPSKEVWEKLQLDPLIPLINYYKITPDLVSMFDKLLLIAEQGKANPVNVKHFLQYTHPTSGNLALSIACHCKPEKLYVLGMDLGFRSKDHTHVLDSVYADIEDGQKGQMGTEQLMVRANLPDSDTVYTRGYFDAARVSAEAILHETTQTKVYNLSDGARIKGAIPSHSSEIVLPDYPEKSMDIQAIIQAFQPVEQGMNWEPYSTSGKKLLEQLKNEVINDLSIEPFDWSRFTKVLNKNRLKNFSDLRLEPYVKCIDRLLTNLYKVLLLTPKDGTAEKIYPQVVKALSEVLEQHLNWPDNLDIGFTKNGKKKSSKKMASKIS
ncbi:MAG: DUF115 domain-containing protein [Desulfohalobiaceae bacterium]|nr:DUF115 domain-containing protein [Desulfohalobiaceae bacterium]